MTITAPPPIETTTSSPFGEAVPVTRHPLQPSPLNRRRWQNFKANLMVMMRKLQLPQLGVNLAVMFTTLQVT